MFVYTAKFTKRKVLAGLVVLAAIICGIILLVALGSDRDTGTASSGELRTNEDRVAYLNSLGWVVEETPLESRDVVIPRTFDGVYADYIALQREQDFPLEEYGGMEATRYTYRVKNWQGSEKDVVADILIFGQTVIAGDIQCPALNGFMTRLVP